MRERNFKFEELVQKKHKKIKWIFSERILFWLTFTLLSISKCRKVFNFLKWKPKWAWTRHRVVMDLPRHSTSGKRAACHRRLHVNRAAYPLCVEEKMIDFAWFRRSLSFKLWVMTWLLPSYSYRLSCVVYILAPDPRCLVWVTVNVL